MIKGCPKCDFAMELTIYEWRIAKHDSCPICNKAKLKDFKERK